MFPVLSFSRANVLARSESSIRMRVPQYKEEYSRKGVFHESVDGPAEGSLTRWKLRYVKHISAIVEWALSRRSGCVQRCSCKVREINLTVGVHFSIVTSL